MTTEPKTIDLTPTWEAIMPVLIAIIQAGDSNGFAREELTRLARMQDARVAEAKAALKEREAAS